MTDHTSSTTPPGWYPAADGTTRWWDGSAWGPAQGAAQPTAAKKRGPLVPILACVGVAFVLLVIGAIASGSDPEETAERPSTTTTASDEEEPTTTARPTTTEAPTTTARPTTTEAPTTTARPTTTTAPPPPTTADPFANETVSQRNARESAVSYLEYTAFSRTGLIEQLVFEQFSEGDATYAVDALHVDWNEQAAKSAADYLEYTSFSRQGLIDQLVFEGFTPAEAEHGVSTTGL